MDRFQYGEYPFGLISVDVPYGQILVDIRFRLCPPCLMNICIIAITMLCQCFLIHHYILLSLSTDPGKGNDERASQEDSLHTEVKSECI